MDRSSKAGADAILRSLVPRRRGRKHPILRMPRAGNHRVRGTASLHPFLARGAGPHEDRGTGAARSDGVSIRGRISHTAVEVHPDTQAQPCWVHKRPSSCSIVCQSPCKRKLNPRSRPSLWRRPVRRPMRPLTASSAPIRRSYPKAVDKLRRDREALLAFYDFPAEHWQPIRSTNPIRIDLRDHPPLEQPNEELCLEKHAPWACVSARPRGRERLGTHLRLRTHRGHGSGRGIQRWNSYYRNNDGQQPAS